MLFCQIEENIASFGKEHVIFNDIKTNLGALEGRL
jgi:hypothetical protein